MSNQTTGSPDNSAELERLKAENEKLKADQQAAAEANQKREFSMVDQQAAAFAENLVNEKRILPAGRDAVAALFSQAVKDDNRDGAACFSDDGAIIEGERVKNLRALIDSLPQPAMLKTANFNVLGHTQAPNQDQEMIPIDPSALRSGGKN